MSINRPFMDSCQRGNTIQQKYVSAVGSAYINDPGGFGNKVLNVGSSFPDCRAVFPVSAVGWVATFRWAVTNLPSSGISGIVGFFDGVAGVEQGGICINSDGTLQAYKNNAAEGSKTTQSFLPGQVLQLQVKYIVDPVNGLIEARLQGQPGALLSFTGNTRTTANSFANAINFKTTPFSVNGNYFSDIFLFDTVNPAAGTEYDTLVDYPGNVKVALLMPNNDSATGGLNQMTPTPAQPAGSHYLDINHTATLGDTQYLAAATAPLRESFQLPALPASAAEIVGLLPFDLSRIDDAGPHTNRLGLRNNGADTFTTDFTPLSSYGYQEGFFRTNPGTSGLFVPADIPNTEVQVEQDS
jgi:hypothetical protein